jgi:methionyl-tRNA synthetase
MPDSCGKILAQIGAAGSETGYYSAGGFGGLPKNVTVKKGEIIFPRLDLLKELEALSNI